jgi:iron complex transport system substrate-binding protein
MKNILYLLLFLSNFIFVEMIFSKSDYKIVSLAPNLTEIVYALGLGDNLVGNTFLCDYPEEAKKIEKIGNFNAPNIEKIISLKTNIVLATEGNPKDKLNTINNLGIKVIYFKADSIHDLAAEIIKLGSYLEKKEKANFISESILKSYNNLKSSKNNLSFLFALQFNPVYSFSDNTWLGDLFKQAGFKNIVGSSLIKYPKITNEFLINHKPKIILAGTLDGKNYQESFNIQKLNIENIYGEKAKSIKLIIVPKDILVRPGPRIVEGIKFLESLKIEK